MPTIPALEGFIDGDTAIPHQVYEGPTSGGVYAPGNTDTFEVLNGGLDADNLAATGLPANLLQRGTLARAVFLPWSQFAYYYAKQGTGSDTETVVGRLAVEFFLPWEASVVLVGYQGLFNQDATDFDTAGTPDAERWELAVFVDGVEGGGLSAGLPSARATIDAAITTPIVNDAGYADETRWRHVARAFIETGMARGNHRVEVRLRPNPIFSPDNYTAKVAEGAGSIYVIAFR